MILVCQIDRDLEGLRIYDETTPVEQTDPKVGLVRAKAKVLDGSFVVEDLRQRQFLGYHIIRVGYRLAINNSPAPKIDYVYLTEIVRDQNLIAGFMESDIGKVQIISQVCLQILIFLAAEVCGESILVSHNLVFYRKDVGFPYALLYEIEPEDYSVVYVKCQEVRFAFYGKQFLDHAVMPEDCEHNFMFLEVVDYLRVVLTPDYYDRQLRMDFEVQWE